ncbi:Ig-like domain-containing protein [Fulvivirga ligni]|uniref:Ig-like domain-containing protein n=1 Tax=Fulvivirga ligni TaxID=2904246 RepID=UPI001F3F16EE|nr:Ig-like domain-containing protein [Fulvivirga ligni]UII19136.1 Ig-like domain-containing protein [Fulvivirga ligni]
MILTFQSCADDPKDVDDIKPDVEFNNLAEGDNVWNTIEIQASAIDDISIASIQLLVDDQLIASKENQETITSNWNTGDLEDGAHTLKVVGTDNSGNISEKEISVNVKNNLIKLQVLDSKLPHEQKGYIFLSDRNGNVIVSDELRAGEELILKNSEFEDSIFYLTEVYDSDIRNYRLLNTFSDIKSGREWRITPLKSQSNDTFQAHITFKNAAESVYYRAYTSGYNEEFIRKGLNNTRTVELSSNPGVIYVVKFDNEHNPLTYRLFTDINEGENTLDLDEVNIPFKNLEFNLPDYDSYYLFIWGLYGDIELNDEYEVFNESSIESGTTSTRLFYAEEAFDQHQLQFSYSKGRYQYRQYSYGIDNMIVKEVSHNSNFEIKNNTLSYSSSGNFDYINYSVDGYINDKRIMWQMLLPKANERTVPIFHLPDHLEPLNILNTENSKSISLEEYSGLNGYEELLQFVTTSDSFNESKAGHTHSAIDFSLDTENGKKRNTQAPTLFERWLNLKK